jgi:hypothetical protein
MINKGIGMKKKIVANLQGEAALRQELWAAVLGTQESACCQETRQDPSTLTLLTVFPLKRIPSSESKTEPFKEISCLPSSTPDGEP